MIDNKIVIFEDVEMGKIYNELPNVSILVRRDGPDEYSDDYDICKKH